MQQGRMYLTRLGRNLLAKGQAGNQLHFTKFVLGDGEIEDTEELLTLTSLKNQKLETGFRNNSVTVNNDGTATMSIIITNDNNDMWLDFREFGVYAQDPDIGEILYAVGSNGAHPDPIPPSSMKSWEMKMDIIVMIGNCENLEITIDRSMTYVTHDEYWKLAGEGWTHPSVKELYMMLSDLNRKVIGHESGQVDGKEANVFSVDHKTVEPEEQVDGVYLKIEGAFIV